MEKRRRENKRERRRRRKQAGGTKSWAVCQGLFHLCSPGLSELPPSLTSVMASMKRPLGGMEDLTRGSDCDRHQLTLLELIGCHFQVQGTRQGFFSNIFVACAQQNQEILQRLR